MTLITIRAAKSKGFSNLFPIGQDVTTTIQPYLSEGQVVDGTDVHPLGNLLPGIIFVDSWTNLKLFTNVLYGLLFTRNASYTVFARLAQVAYQTTFSATALFVKVIFYQYPRRQQTLGRHILFRIDVIKVTLGVAFCIFERVALNHKVDGTHFICKMTTIFYEIPKFLTDFVSVPFLIARMQQVVSSSAVHLFLTLTRQYGQVDLKYVFASSSSTLS